MIQEDYTQQYTIPGFSFEQDCSIREINEKILNSLKPELKHKLNLKYITLMKKYNENNNLTISELNILSRISIFYNDYQFLLSEPGLFGRIEKFNLIKSIQLTTYYLLSECNDHIHAFNYIIDELINSDFYDNPDIQYYLFNTCINTYDDSFVSRSECQKNKLNFISFIQLSLEIIPMLVNSWISENSSMNRILRVFDEKFLIDYFDIVRNSSNTSIDSMLQLSSRIDNFLNEFAVKMYDIDLLFEKNPLVIKKIDVMNRPQMVPHNIYEIKLRLSKITSDGMIKHGFLSEDKSNNDFIATFQYCWDFDDTFGSDVKRQKKPKKIKKPSKLKLIKI